MVFGKKKFLHIKCVFWFSLQSSGSSSPLCLSILKEGSRVCQKHNCFGIVFIAAIVTTCFGRVASTPDRILHIPSPQKPSPLEPHPHRTSPTQTAAANQPDIQSCFSHLCTTSTLRPEDGQARPKHVVTIAEINTIPRQLCFWRTLLPSFLYNYCLKNFSF
jgi:hypothetical protein